MAFAPLAHIISKRAKDRVDKKNARVTNHSPFVVAPRVGLYGYLPLEAAAYSTLEPDTPDLPFKCKSYHVEAKVMHTTVKVRITMNIMIATDDFDFYFPISECGDVSDVHTSIRGFNFTPTVVRRGPPSCDTDETAASHSPKTDEEVAPNTAGKKYNPDTTGLIPSTDKRRFLPNDSDDVTKDSKEVPISEVRSKHPKTRQEPPLYYLHVSHLSEVIRSAANDGDALDTSKPLFTRPSSAARAAPLPGVASVSVPSDQNRQSVIRPFQVGNTVRVVVSYTTKLLEREPIGKRYHFFFPLSCAPIPPTSMNVEFAMKENIQRIVSLNESHTIRQYYRGDKAEVMVVNEPVDENRSTAEKQFSSQPSASRNIEGKTANDLQNDAAREALGNRPKVQRGQRPPISGTTENPKPNSLPQEKQSSSKKRESSIMLEDYVFVLVVELGPVIIPQFADPMTIFILATAAAAFVFAALTKNLDDLY